jgi:hypothetical protein
MSDLDVETILYIFERTCLRKKNLTEEDANVIVDIEARHGRLIYFYKCQFCLSFHMTSKIKEPTRQIFLN